MAKPKRRRVRFLTGGAPIAAVEVDENGRIDKSNDAFNQLFFESFSDDDPFRAAASRTDMIRDFRARNRREKIGRELRREFGAFDFFHKWEKNDTELVFWIGYPRSAVEVPDGETVPPMSDHRHFRFWERSVKRKRKGKKVNRTKIELIDITEEQRHRKMVAETETAFSQYVRRLMVDPGLGERTLFYDIKQKFGAAGGDFVFASKVRGHEMVVAMFGDSAKEGIVGALTSSLVGWTLNDACFNPQPAMLRHPNPALWMLKVLDDTLIRRTQSVMDGLDGVLCAADFRREKLFWANGNFDLLTADLRAGNVVKSLRYVCGAGAGGIKATDKKSIGIENDAVDFEDGELPLGPGTFLFSFSDGVRDAIDRIENRGTKQKKAGGGIHPMERRLRDRFQKLQSKRRFGSLEMKRLVAELRKELDNAGHNASMRSVMRRLDDEMMVAFVPGRAIRKDDAEPDSVD